MKFYVRLKETKFWASDENYYRQEFKPTKIKAAFHRLLFLQNASF